MFAAARPYWTFKAYVFHVVVATLVLSTPLQGGCLPPTAFNQTDSRPSQKTGNGFYATVLEPVDPKHNPLHTGLLAFNTPASIANLFNILLQLDSFGPIPFVFKSCDGAPNAYYHPGQSHILICYEFIVEMNIRLGKTGSSRYEYDRSTKEALLFVMFHEAAHALIDGLQIRMWGPEEDLADQFAYLLMTSVDETAVSERVVRAAVAYFHNPATETIEHSPDDTHRSAQNRAFEGVCLLYGRYREPKLGKVLGQRFQQPCIDTYQDVFKRWNEALAPYSRVESGRTFQSQ